MFSEFCNALMEEGGFLRCKSLSVRLGRWGVSLRFAQGGRIFFPKLRDCRRERGGASSG